PPPPPPTPPPPPGGPPSPPPPFRGELAPGTVGARLEVCADRACTRVLMSGDPVGSLARVDTDLPTCGGFCRLFGRAGGAIGSTPGPTWPLTIGVLSAPVDTS